MGGGGVAFVGCFDGHLFHFHINYDGSKTPNFF